MEFRAGLYKLHSIQLYKPPLISISRKEFLKNTGLLLAGSVVFKKNIFAEVNHKQNTPTCLKDLFLTYDLTSDTTPFSTVTKITDISYAKVPANTNCKDVAYDSELEHDPCIPNEEPCDDEGIVLKYDVYYPPYTNYANCPLPIVIYVHGGGFSDCSSKDSDDADFICRQLAKRSFVVYNIGYRTGRQIDNINPPSPYTTVQQELAIYRAFQDIRGAIRTIIYRGNNPLPNTSYSVNTDFIFLAGSSAGSATVLSAAYYSDPSQIYQIFPNSGTYSIIQALGPIDADFYDSDPTTEYISHIKAVLNIWGSISLPYSYFNNHEKDFFQGYPNPPVISFHGKLDPVFPYKYQDVDFSPDTTEELDFNSENACLIITPSSFQTEGSLPPPHDLKAYGSQGFFERVLQQLPVFSEYYLDTLMQHGLKFTTGFGLNTNNENTVQKYIIKRGTTFSKQSLLK